MVENMDIYSYTYNQLLKLAITAMHGPHGLVQSGNKDRFSPFRYIYYLYGDKWKTEKKFIWPITRCFLKNNKSWIEYRPLT